MLVRVIKVLIVLLIVANVFWYGFRYSAPFHVAVLVLAGHSPHCGLVDAVRGRQNASRHDEITNRLSREVRQIRSDPAGLVLWQTPGGPLWTPKSDAGLLPHLLAEEERNVYGRGAQGIRPGDIVLDCGAHVGVYTRQALKEGARLVVAIEPAPDNLECLRRNFAAEIAARRVVVCGKGVWDKEDFLTLETYPDNSARDSFEVRWQEARPGPKVPLTTIDKLAADLQLERVDFVKMDIEGAERRALDGARSTLARYRPRLAIAAYHNPDDPEAIPRAVRSAWSGYRVGCGPCAEANFLIGPDVMYFW